MKSWMRLHRYLSCLVAPAMVFFAVSGAWQAYRLQERPKNGSYVPPPVVVALSQAHMAERLTPARTALFRLTQLAIATLFVATAGIGVGMALRLARPVWPVWLALAAGVALPVALALWARAG